MSAPTSPIVPVTSLDDPALAPFARLTDPQLRSRLDPEMGIFIAEGLGICQIALQKGLQPLAMLTEEKHVTGKAAPLIAALGGAPVYVAPAEQLARLTGYPLTRGVLTAFYRPAPRDAHALVAGAHRLAVLEQLNDDMLSEVKEKGEYLRSLLLELPGVVEVRGMGLMLGAGLREGCNAGALVKAMVESGVLCLTAGHNTIRLLPPLTISREEIDQGVAVMRRVMEEAL